MKDWLAAHLPESVVTIIAFVTAWFTQRGARLRAHHKRIQKLETERVTREDFDELRESMNATFTNGMDRLERRTDEILLHMARKDYR